MDEDESSLFIRYIHEIDDLDEEEEWETRAIVGATNAGASRRHRGSVPGRAVVERDHFGGDATIRADYFSDTAMYTDAQFRRRFRIVEAVQGVDPYFVQKTDCTGKSGLSALQKVVATIRILAYGVPADAVDEYVRIGKSTAQESLKHFCKAVIMTFGGVYLRAPTADDQARLLHIAETRGFPGMLSSIDCMLWEWRNCLTAWKGMFTGRGKHPSMILEAVASYDLWIWHAYFGLPGSNNDINVLQWSPIFSRYVRGESPPISFTVNGNNYDDMGYYLADGIYPDWPAFIKTVRHPMEMKTQHFAARQEGARKDIERAFGVLQARWAIVRGPAYGWNRSQISDIMTACIIMHNMIIEDERAMSGTSTSTMLATYLKPVPLTFRNVIGLYELIIDFATAMHT